MTREDVIQLYEPTVKEDMKITYPELGKIKEFQPLTGKELRLCWMIGSPTSPLRKKKKTKIDKKLRVEEAVFSIYSQNNVDINKDLSALLSGRVPQRFAAAIKRWAQFDISIRLRAYFMAETQFNVLEAMSYVEQDDFEGFGPADFKEYAATAKSIQSQIPDLIRIIEGGYGVELKQALDDNLEFEVKVTIDDTES